MDDGLVDDAAHRRYELAVEGGTAVLEYTRDGHRLALVHTAVPEALEGRGIGTRLVRAALDRARANGDRIVPVCPFVTDVLKRHPEYADLVAAS